MSDVEQMTAVARDRADECIDKALGELHAAAQRIGEKAGIPDNIAGQSIEQLLGRMAYIPTQARDLRRACAQELAKQNIAAFLSGDTPRPELAPKVDIPVVEPSKIPGSIPVGMDIGSVEGISVQTLAALRASGLTSIGDIVNVPDEHLCKIQGMGEKSVAHLRVASAKVSEVKG